MTIAIVDYGAGNLRSASKAFEHVAAGETVLVTSDPGDILKASHVVLPGVGAFADCRNSLHAVPGMVDALRDVVLEKQRPFLGICVGMQLMATIGEEHGAYDGLNWIPGRVVAIEPEDKSLKIPHMGWNRLLNIKPHAVLEGFCDESFVYFVHSYHFKTDRPEDCLATAAYGEDINAIIGHENMVGTQFHPEKSQKWGLKLIENFVRWTA